MPQPNRSRLAWVGNLIEILIVGLLAGCLASGIPSSPSNDPASEPEPEPGQNLAADTDTVSVVTEAPDSTETTDTGTPPDAGPAVADIAAQYAAYQKITDKVIQVNPELAMLCRGANAEDIAKARVLHGPHAFTGILIYMNDPAAETFAAQGASYPVGSVVVKHKTMNRYRSGSAWVQDADNGVGGMVKRAPGYDPDHGDWEYFYFEDGGPVESGRIQSCVQCHAGAKNTDYVFGSWKKP